MARPYHCLCFYYVQGEEGESPEEPNSFQVGATFKSDVHVPVCDPSLP